MTAPVLLPGLPRAAARCASKPAITDAVLNAYRWQYIVSGVREGRFLGLLTEFVTPAQAARITNALAPLLS